jgi:hypothetical protein
MSRADESRRIPISRGVDYLGIIGANLRNLTGIKSLAHELIQNADDAPDASWIAFDVRPEALIVSNDGVFSDCGSRTAPECETESRDATLCDFHSFRRVAGGAKRLKEDTTGAFGIGFTAVYQVTDRPELISDGIHWFIDDTLPEDDRINECPGCTSCQGVRGTRFLLPWALDPRSPMRKALRAAHVEASSIPSFVDALKSDAPSSILFLRNLSSIQIAAEGDEVLTVTRVLGRDKVLVSDGETDETIYLLRGEFAKASEALRSRFGTHIEQGRTAEVTVAVPERSTPGLFFAFLPTEISTDITCHVNADFYPTSDRKRLIFETDYQSDWNRAAIEASAETLASGLQRIRDQIGGLRVWEILEHAFARFAAVGNSNEPHRRAFWDELRSVAQDAPITRTSSGEWAALSDLVLLQQQSTESIVPTLEALRIQVVSSDVRPLVFMARQAGGIHVEFLRPRHVAASLLSSGLVERTERDGLPHPLRSQEMRDAFLTELALLLERSAAADRRDELAALGGCTLLPGSDGAIWPPEHLFRADAPTRSVFDPLLPEIVYLDESAIPEEARSLSEMCPGLSAVEAVRLLHDADNDLEVMSTSSGDDLLPLIGWFDSHRNELDEESGAQLASLPIFPSEGSLRPLTRLSLPGAFDDPLQLAGILDTEQVTGHLDFIRSLGAQELSLHEYATLHLPNAIEEGLERRSLEAVIRLLSDHVGRLRDDSDAHLALAHLALIPCDDDVVREGAGCYFDSPTVRAVLGRNAPIASVDGDARRDLFEWLGVRTQPTLEDIVRRLETVTTDPPSQSSQRAIAEVFSHLSSRGNELTASPQLASLRQLSWLPARPSVDLWHMPAEVFALFQAHLFASQAEILDLPQRIQQQGSDLMELLGIRTAPTTDLVVDHLLHQASHNLEVSTGVYLWLNNNAGHPSLNRLMGVACLRLETGAFIRPDHAFWRPHPFGRFRYVLADDWQQYRKALDRIGVREEPTATDAIAILGELARQLGRGNTPPNDDERSVIAGAWGMIQDELERESILSSDVRRLGSIKSICDAAGLLTVPDRLLFRNDQWLASRFGPSLGANLIDADASSWRAMRVAGVRLLSDAVDRSLSRKVVTGEARDVARVISERLDQLVRVVESVASETDPATLLGRIRTLSYVRCSEMEVSLELHALGQHPLIHEQTPAFFDAREATLYMLDDPEKHWAVIARELARGLCPDEDASRFALGFKEVLSARTLEDATAALDDAGIAVLVATDVVAPATDAVSGPGGNYANDSVDTDQWIDQTAEEASVVRTSENARETGDTTEPATVLAGAHEDGESTEDSDIAAETSETLAEAMSRGTDRPRLRRPRAVITVISYDEPEAAEGDPESQRHRSEVDKAGIAQVVAFEKMAGRQPREMPHDNPGYDIESLDSEGNVLRYIEVKALGSAWDANVAITEAQYRTAQRLRERFWLYVVPAALDPLTSHPIRVQDPVGHVTLYRFDQGWADLGESAIGRQPSAIRLDDLPPELREVVDEIRGAEGIPDPILGYWLAGPDGEPEWQAEAAWPDQKLVLCGNPDAQRDEFLSVQGWTIAVPPEWSAEELVELLRGER